MVSIHEGWPTWFQNARGIAKVKLPGSPEKETATRAIAIPQNSGSGPIALGTALPKRGGPRERVERADFVPFEGKLRKVLLP